jgi:hypothetical protein
MICYVVPDRHYAKYIIHLSTDIPSLMGLGIAIQNSSETFHYHTKATIRPKNNLTKYD